MGPKAIFCNEVANLHVIKEVIMLFMYILK